MMVALARRRGGAALVAAGLAACSLALVVPRASASPTAACTGDDGVTVVVDFGTLGGGVQVRCVTETVSSGFEALSQAGFSYAGTTRFPGLLCRIDGKPSAAQEACHNAPPSDFYWAYWTAPAPGGAWTYNDMGAGNRTPPPGSVEGWAFSDGCDRKPGSGPCPAGATTTTRPPTTTTVRPPTGGSGTTTPTQAGGAGLPSSGGPGEPSTTTTAAGDPTATTTRAGDRAPGPGEPGDVALAADRSSGPADDDGGSPAGALVGGGAVVALAVGGAVTARRRRAHLGADQ